MHDFKTESCTALRRYYQDEFLDSRLIFKISYSYLPRSVYTKTCENGFRENPMKMS